MNSLSSLVRGGALVALLLLGKGVAHASDFQFVVNTTSDSDGTCDPSGSAGSSCSLRQAINSANAAYSGVSDYIRISFDPSVFAGKQTLSLSGGELPLIQGNITLSGPTTPGAGLTIAQSDSSVATIPTRSGYVNLENVTISGGSVGVDVRGGLVTVRNCALIGNATGLSTYSTTTLQNCTLSNNTTNGLFNDGTFVTLQNCTLSGNDTGVYNGPYGEVTLSNSIVAGNSTNNLYRLDDTATYTTEYSITGGDAKLGPLADNGGPTPTQALLLGSPAIDKGNSTLTTDQRGSVRPVVVTTVTGDGNGSDIGAYEYDAPQSGSQFIVNSVDDHSDGTCGVADCTLREALEAANTTSDRKDIVFSALFNVRRTITLRGTPLRIASNINLVTAGPDFLTIDGAKTSRIFDISLAGVSLQGLTLRNGFTTGDGGAIRVTNGGILSLRYSTLTGNSAANGGGIAIEADSRGEAQSAEITNCTISGNRASDAGGGVYATDATVVLGDCTVADNAANDGGGIANEGSAQFILDSSTVSGNSAARGAGLINDRAGNLTIRNSTVAQNIASQSGGGLAIVSGQAKVDMVTLALNSATSSGGGIFNVDGTTLGITNTLLGNNTAPTGPDVYGFSTSGDYNLVSDATGSTVLGTHNIIGQNPKIGALQDNGGPTQTIAIAFDSPARDAGNISAGGFLGTPACDQRGLGFPRSRNRGLDIGAYEFQNEAPVLMAIGLTPTRPKTNDPLVVTAIANDTGATALSYTYVWTRLRAGRTTTLRTTVTTQTSNTLPTRGTTVSAGDLITVSVTANDGLENSLTKSARVTIANSPVSITSLSLSPAPPRTNNTLVASVTSSDDDETQPTYTYLWQKTSAGKTTNLLSISTTNRQAKIDLSKAGVGNKGDVVTVTVTASDGASSSTKTVRITVANTVPVITTLSLSPTAPQRTGVVSARVTAVDPDATDGVDKLTYIYKWRVGTHGLSTETQSSLNLSKYSFVKPGDTVYLEVRANDGSSMSVTRTTSVRVAAPPSNPTSPSTPGA